MVLAAAGGVHHRQLTELADMYFGGLSSSHEGEVPPACRLACTIALHCDYR